MGSPIRGAGSLRGGTEGLQAGNQFQLNIREDQLLKMAVKEWFRKLQPVKLYMILFSTFTFFFIELVVSYVTHSLTLLLNAYHMLCNIIALVGCVASTKQTNSDRRMKSTFGWARIDIITMLICCVFLASFCFSLLMEALQTLIHIDHLDAMHHPLPVMCIGVSGILLNAFCYILIGGYTFNQSTHLHVSKTGNVISHRSVTLLENQSVRHVVRDLLGCIFVIADSMLVYLTDSYNARLIDPIFAVISSISLFVLSYPYMKESGLILLQTIPNHINIESLKRELLEAFPGIVNVHDLHVWQLAGESVISTVHVIFLDSMIYANITDEVTSFFVEMGITQVTIQPEFHKMRSNLFKMDCLISCHGEYCQLSQCCTHDKLLFVQVDDNPSMDHH
ncbi:zinc transporter 1 isoform X2 [Belonocnema kinseyi]|uniref:zinc transporter 1 isoform X2 n=1 Tax=Belonocnema kinseyi TaxID=2817044 RepID=UPI00143D7C6C|nr:zinc transporter 1 isoform X2 [Belonocnema kinseyi]XP_033216827.1 zinc transporter 1 isoform X2 [Belonocnema kinseyi]